MLAKDIFAEQSKLESLAKRIMLDIQNIISCKRCILYLITFTPPAEEVSLKFNDFTFIQSSDTSFTYNSNNLLALDCLTQLFSNWVAAHKRVLEPSQGRDNAICKNFITVMTVYK